MKFPRFLPQLAVAFCLLPLAASAAPANAGMAMPASQAVLQERKLLNHEPPPALLTIHFNKKHVSYAPQLKKAIKAAEKAKPGVVFYVVSYEALPPSGSNMTNEGDRNLMQVTEAIEKLGVPAARVTSSTQTSAEAVQKIVIYVQ